MSAPQWEKIEGTGWLLKIDRFRLYVLRGNGGWWWSIWLEVGEELDKGWCADPDKAKADCLKALAAYAQKILNAALAAQSTQESR